MATISKAVQEAHRFTAALIPADVIKAIPQDELLDRLVYAEDLARRAANAQDATIRKGYSAIAKAVLAAPPRAQVAAEVAELHARAAGLGPYDHRAADLRRQAEHLIEQNPPAPRREDVVPVAKARAGRPAATVVYDAAGHVLGLCDQARIRPLPAGKVRVPTQAPGRRPGPR